MKNRTVKACVQEAEALLEKQMESKKASPAGMLFSRLNSVRFAIRYLQNALDV